MNISEAVSIEGPGADALTIDANQSSRILYLNDVGARSYISGVGLTGGRTAGNVEDGGGAIRATNGSPLTITDSTLSGNLTAGGLGSGGAIYATYSLLTITDSTLSGNSTAGDSGKRRRDLRFQLPPDDHRLHPLGQFDGGELRRRRRDRSRLKQLSSDDHQLHPLGQLDGGAQLQRRRDPRLQLPPERRLDHDRRQQGDQLGGGGGVYLNNSSANLDNTILADNDANDPNYEDLYTLSSTATLTYSLLENPGSASINTSSGDNITGQDPSLAPLADNGGPTQTQALQSGSPAIDAGQTTLATDQRGVSRPQGSADDIGAYELDTTGPEVTIDSKPRPPPPIRPRPSSSPPPDTDGDLAGFQCRIDGAPFADCTSPFTAEQLEAGSHSFEVRATDDLGNQGTPASYAFTVVGPGPGPGQPPPTPTPQPAPSSCNATDPNRIIGTDQGETILGTDLADLIEGQGGPDTIVGEDAGDCLYGNSGRDVLRGKSGDDQLFGGPGRDTLKGNAGDDQLRGGGDFDRLRGAAGNGHPQGRGRRRLDQRRPRSRRAPRRSGR